MGLLNLATLACLACLFALFSNSALSRADVSTINEGVFQIIFLPLDHDHGSCPCSPLIPLRIYASCIHLTHTHSPKSKPDLSVCSDFGCEHSITVTCLGSQLSPPRCLTNATGKTPLHHKCCPNLCPTIHRRLKIKRSRRAKLIAPSAFGGKVGKSVGVYASFNSCCRSFLAQLYRPQMNKRCKSRALQREEAEFEADLAEISRSIEKSRKRNLEVGLLRGDLVQDRLAVQEVSASPVLKRPRPEPEASPSPPSKMAMSMADFCAYMDEKINPKLAGLDDIKQKIDRMDETVKGNSVRLDRQEATAKMNQAHIAEIRAELRSIRDEPTAQHEPSPPAAVPRQSQRLHDEDLARARRSLRLWPVPGNSRLELWRAAGAFVTQNLGLTDLAESVFEDVSKVALPSGPGVKDEVLVRFKDPTVRDSVIGSSAKLAPFRDANGRPTAGIRIEVPPHLQTEFRALFRYGQLLRTRHGPGTRRHVKFDDAQSGLFLNAKLPGDENWSRISVDVARRGLRARDQVMNGALERRLDISGPPHDRQRSASTSHPPPSPMDTRDRRAGSTSEL